MEGETREESTREFKFKVVLLGDGAVGKSSLVLRYVQNKFSPRHLSTIQASFQTRQIWIDECKVELNIWDTAGQEKYHALGPIYYRGSNGVLLIYDITEGRSFEKVKMWVRELKATLGESVVIMIVGNKIDLEAERSVSQFEVQRYVDSENVLYTETSAIENIGVSKAFELLAEKMIEKWRENERNSPVDLTRSIQLVDDEEIGRRRQKKCC